MANLKGSDFTKQIRDANYRLNAFGIKRRGDHLTHSRGTFLNRNSILRDIQVFFEKEGLSGKMNLLMTEERMDKFLAEKLPILKNNTSMKYVTTLSSLRKGLEEVNIKMQLNDNFFSKKRDAIRSEHYGKTDKEDFIQINRYIKSVSSYIDNIKEEVAQAYAAVLINTGFRRHEAEALMRAIHTFDGDVNRKVQKSHNMTFKLNKYQEVVINGVNGKGGRLYKVDKYIPQSLFAKIKAFPKIHSSSKLNKDLGNHKAHDFRYTFARDFYMRAKESGMSEREALAATSQELGHNRIAMTRYYLKRSWT